MVLRGVCLMRREDIDWVFGGGCKALVPQAWERFLAGLTEEEHAAPLQAYYRRLTHPDDSIRRSAAAHWSSLERSLNLNSTDKLQVWRGAEWTPYALAEYAPVGPPAPNQIAARGEAEKPRSVEHTPLDAAFAGGREYAALAQAILTCHYSVTAGSGHHGDEGLDLLSHIDRIRHIPTVAVHGRQDVVCPIRTAWDLHSAWPEMELQVAPGSGHSMYEPAVTHCLLNATDRMARIAAAMN